MLQRFFLTFALLVASVAAPAQTFPPLTGRVVDTANILDPTQEQALTAKLEAIEDQSGRQVVVAPLDDLKGYDIADYGYRSGRTWGIGQKGEDKRQLLLMPPSARKLRHE